MCWKATYTTRVFSGRLPKSVSYSIPGTEMKECPASFITPESAALVQEIAAAEHVKEATGAVLFGTDSGRWDARFFDAVRLIHIEDIRIQNEDFEATRSV